MKGYKVGLISKDLDIIPSMGIDWNTSTPRELHEYIEGYEVGVNAHE